MTKARVFSLFHVEQKIELVSDMLGLQTTTPQAFKPCIIGL